MRLQLNYWTGINVKVAIYRFVKMSQANRHTSILSYQKQQKKPLSTIVKLVAKQKKNL